MEIYRGNSVIKAVKIDEQTVFSDRIGGENKVVSSFILPEPFEFQLRDYINLGAEKYYLNAPAAVQKVNNFTYAYQATFEGEIYTLFNKLLMHLGESEFTYYGTPYDFLLLIVENMNSISSGWIAGQAEDLEPQLIAFQGDSCRTALTKVCDAFELELRLVQREIQLKRVIGNLTNTTFEYGRNKGLKGFTRQNVNEKGVVTRLYGFGGERNIGFDYRGGAKKLVFEDKYLEDFSYVDEVIEGVVTFPDIYPRRTGEVASSPAITQVVDPTIDFDLNGRKISDDRPPKIVFKSGALSGYEFVIDTYNHAAKLITFVQKDDGGYLIPNELNFPEPGDAYTLVDIMMPQSYVEAAEMELETATAAKLETMKSPQVTYVLDIDEKYVRTYGLDIKVGDRVRIIDEAMSINSQIRVSQISFPLVNPSDITAVIADTIPYTPAERIRKELAANKNEIITIDLSRSESIREAVERIRQLQGLIYDPEGYFDTDNIRPGSIETGMLAVGVGSQNFALNGVEIEANYQGNANSLRISGGKLVHFEMEIEGLGYIWEIDPLVINTLVAGNSYYVYANVSKSSLSGTWKVSSTPLELEGETGRWHFWLGILYAVNNGRRYFMFTKGMTFIVGDTITTGRITSQDGLNFFDLTQGTFKIGDSEQGLDWGITDVGQLTINGALVTKMAFAEDAEIINLIVKNLRTSLSGKHIHISEEENNLRFYDESGTLVLVLDDNIDADQAGEPLAGIRVSHGTQVAYLSGNGVFSNASGYSFIPGSSGIETNASVVGLLQRRNSDPLGVSAGVVGMDQTTTGASRSYGGYFNTAFIGGLNVQCQRTESSVVVGNVDCLISCYNTSPITITLPANPGESRVLFLRKNNNVDVTVQGNGNQIVNDTPVSSINITGVWSTAVVMWDGQYWMYNVLPRQ